MTKLLLIDDDDTTREVLALLLRADGWEVADAAGGDEAVPLAASFSPDVILSDLQMPGLCGSDLARALRSADGGKAVLLAMTATRLPTAPDGYDALLVKPFAASAVRDAVSGMADSNAAQDKNSPVLSLTTFHRIRDAMPAAQLQALYDFALNDAERRVRAMESTVDDQTVRREAHALKGSCGMIGAERLGVLSASVEQHGMPQSPMKVRLVEDFRGEISAVRRMLEELSSSDK